ncbi:MAG: hypothetical protein EPO31_05915 [Gammaproteobacteria bacterium]|jgi:hypothetical protein|nr:MAG: hypothetical protein EPO31_05915 [Gammaproteobacteria bacterium]
MAISFASKLLTIATLLAGMHAGMAAGLTIRIGNTGNNPYGNRYATQRHPYTTTFRAPLTIRYNSGNQFGNYRTFDQPINGRSIILYDGDNRCDALCRQDQTNEYYRNIRRQNERNPKANYSGYHSYRQGYRDGYFDGRRSARERDNDWDRRDDNNRHEDRRRDGDRRPGR